MYANIPKIGRLDTPGPLHHVMIRGIGPRKILNQGKDCKNFKERLSLFLPETSIQCESGYQQEILIIWICKVPVLGKF